MGKKGGTQRQRGHGTEGGPHSDRPEEEEKRGSHIQEGARFKVKTGYSTKGAALFLREPAGFFGLM